MQHTSCQQLAFEKLAAALEEQNLVKLLRVPEIVL